MKIELFNKTINISPWKGRDKRLFKDTMDELTPETIGNILNVLVFASIDKKVILSIEEYKYVLSRIRIISIGDDFKITLPCENCGKTSEHSYKISDVIKCSFKNTQYIKTEKTTLKLMDPLNEDMYLTLVGEWEDNDLFVRIAEINGDDALSFEQVVEYFDDLDLNEYNAIFDEWDKHRFTLNDNHEVTCKHCKFSRVYRFDEIPGFIPENWYK